MKLDVMEGRLVRAFPATLTFASSEAPAQSADRFRPSPFASPPQKHGPGSGHVFFSLLEFRLQAELQQTFSRALAGLFVAIVDVRSSIHRAA
jgi:hypothetical protein